MKKYAFFGTSLDVAHVALMNKVGQVVELSERQAAELLRDGAPLVEESTYQDVGLTAEEIEAGWKSDLFAEKMALLREFATLERAKYFE